VRRQVGQGKTCQTLGGFCKTFNEKCKTTGSLDSGARWFFGVTGPCIQGFERRPSHANLVV
jgi:hypothetical protein